MSATVIELHWFPKYPDRFLTTSGSEINLYQIKNRNEIDLSVPTNIYLNLSKTSTATLVTFETRYQFIRSVAPSYHSNGDILFAAGLPNGKVALCNFASENNVEFTPRFSRPCTCLAWSEYEPSLLAMGHDRNRSDHCITIWDTERGAPKESSILELIGLSETAHSICWDKTSRILIAGMSHKYIKMMDFRQSSPVVTVANTRAVQGLSIAPNGRYLSSYIDNVVGLWDLRSLDKPISQIQMQKNITNLSWCPTRSSVLTSLQRDSPQINLVDLHWPGSEMEGGEPHSVKRYVTPFQLKNVGTTRHATTMAYISWHPTDLERMLVLSSSGMICDYNIPQRVAVSWDNNNSLWGTSGHDLRRVNSPSPLSTPTDSLNPWDIPLNENFEDDIAETIQKRAMNDYGQVTDMHRNGDLAQNQNLRGVWRLLAHMNKEECKLGLKAILGVSSATDGPAMSRSDALTMTWNDFPASGSLKVFRSEQRDFAQLLCGWTFERDKEGSFVAFIDDLCLKQEFTRAALIACFHFKVRFAIEILGKGADQSSDPSSFRIAAIALSGFNVDRTGIWRNQCMMAHAQISDPYLRAMFSFLAPDNDSFDTVLGETGVSLSDRMAFSCNFLSDHKLAEYVKAMVQNCIEFGDLNGLLLTGATNDGINLLQSHLDWTEDVQTVSLIAARFFPSDLITDYRVQYWISTYRDLLDIWGLWEQRAQLDITMGSIRSPPQNSRSVFLLCNFCGKSVSTALQEEARLRNNASVMHKLSSCPHCRKPLPRCSLCLLHMGTTMGAISQNQTVQGQIGWQSKPFSKWFSWCQTCRHGGHTEHLAEWFNQNSECPVTSCSCKCFAMDLPMPQFPREKEVAS